ncbi:hypothetical protein H310_11383 [Aphanomyces invadans]|uniref:Uncharacterized protein n=1 Tax=Aphanomyces invadans TaxID=157072 RepID=A0A024TLQ7_9STRA|nr:hypothetical protein H310_11383 [Aphanomyces invadans]ETV95100.1 hypothetical protein H310_11383 [Aphanomyces invadans]|eukprot:XP_008876273.1 hypothetical protein H310_11383 [Aphanomyces invadans]
MMANGTIPAVGDTCSSITSCDDCIKTYTCHFCEYDLQCHAIGSTSGCIKGMSTCHHIEDCVRKDPEYVGYGPPGYVVLGVLCLVSTLVCCVGGCTVLIGMIRRGRARSATRATSRRNVAKHSATDVDNDTTTSLLSPVDDVEGGSSSDETPPRAPVDPEPAPRSTFGTLCSRTIWLGSLVGFTICALMYYPRVPDYQICNQQFDWESIFASLISIKPKIHYQIITSVVNENRFAFHLDSGVADISHNGIKVGTWAISNWTAEAGAVSDMLAMVKIEPSTFAESMSLWKDFHYNNLTFQINTNLTGSIRWGSLKLYSFSVQAPAVDFLVGDKYPRDLCKCTEYLTPTNKSLMSLH